MYKVLFENGIFATISPDKLELHKRMQKEYTDICEQKEDYASFLRHKIEIYGYDKKRCIDAFKQYCAALEPRLNRCIEYESISLLPSLLVKIENVEEI